MPEGSDTAAAAGLTSAPYQSPQPHCSARGRAAYNGARIGARAPCRRLSQMPRRARRQQEA